MSLIYLVAAAWPNFVTIAAIVRVIQAHSGLRDHPHRPALRP